MGPPADRPALYNMSYSDALNDPGLHPRVLAQAGNDSQAQYQLGLGYLRDGKLTRNSRLAVHWLREAAHRGHAKAEYMMAMLARTGEGCAPSARLYVEYLKAAAAHLQPQALCDLGNLYCEGVLVPKDLVRSRQLWRQAHGLGCLEAVKKLAKLDDDLSWWQKAAKAGDPEGQYIVAADALKGSGQLSSSEAVDTLKLAAKKRWPEALFLLGEMYRGAMKLPHLNNIVRRDCVKSARYLALSSEALFDQRNKSKHHQEQQEAKLLLFTKHQEGRLLESVHISRVLSRWGAFAQKKRRFLRLMVARYSRRCTRQVVRRWKQRMAREIMAQRHVAQAPFASGCALQRAIDMWRQILSRRALKGIFVRRVCAKSRLRRVLCSWRYCAVRRRTAFFAMIPMLQEWLTSRLRPIFDVYKHHQRIDRGSILLLRIWRRKAIRSFYLWCRNVVETAFSEHRWATRKQHEALHQSLREHRTQTRGLESKVSLWQQRLSREQDLNKKLEGLHTVPSQEFDFRSSRRAPTSQSVERLPASSSGRTLDLRRQNSVNALDFGRRQVASSSQRLQHLSPDTTSVMSEASSSFKSSLDQALERGLSSWIR